MYSNNQWSFNPAVYQNIPYEQVDWASLAQQWIKMKETVPTTTQGPAPPPAPVISKATDTPVPTPTLVPSQPSNDIEGGEAPMDMDTKDDEATTPAVGAAGTSGNWNQWGNWQTQWGWGWSGNSGSVPSTENTPSAASNVDSKVKSTNNDSIAALNDVRNFPIVGNSATTTQVSSTFNYNNTGGTVIPPIIPKSNYSFNNTFPPAGKSSADNWHKGGKSSNRQTPQKPTPLEQFAVLDAAKKKQLPAWIRDGLNKMEREKQKKMERERMVQEKYIIDQMKSEHNEPEPASMPIYVEEPPPRDPPPAMLDYGRRYSPEPPPSSKYQKRRSPSLPRQRSREPQAIRKTKDQIMEESMLKVRRILTEILLEATEKQVQLIAKEEHRRYRSSASAPQIRKSNALTSLTGNLGLDVYDSEDNSSDGERDRDDDIDSDEELKMIIEKKKRDFTLVEDEIERLVEDQEARERLIAQRDSRDEDDIDDDGNEDDEEDEPRARNSRDKDIGGPVSHQRYPDHDRERQSGNVDSRPVDDDRNDYRSSSRRNPAISSSNTSETKQINGDTKSVPTSDAPIGPASSTAEALVEDPARAGKKDESSSSSSSSSGTDARGDHRTSRSHHSSTKRPRSSRRSRSSSSSSSSSASSSSSSSRHDANSKSSSDDDNSAGSNGNKSKRDKRKKTRKSRKKSDTAGKSSSTTSSTKRSKRRSSDDSDSGGGRSTSRSRYHDGKSSSSSYKRTNSRNTDSVERSRRRRSPSYRRRSPSYHRSNSRRDYSSKYKDSPSSSSSRSRRRGVDDYSPESKRSRYRSSSRESSRYKRR